MLVLPRRKYLLAAHLCTGKCGPTDYLHRALGGSPLQCWDNSTRGLDSATALEFVKTLKLSTELGGSAAVVAIYQASQSIYDVCTPNTTIGISVNSVDLRQSRRPVRG